MKKNKIKIFLIFLLLLFLISCKKEIDLPKTPGYPGESEGLFGKAAAMFKTYPDWAAKPDRMFVYPEQIEFDEELRVRILDYDFIYRFGYYFNTKEKKWELFELTGDKRVQDWYLGRTARTTIDIEPDIFQKGDNFLVLYACNKKDGYFDCNDNKWMLTFFTVTKDYYYEDFLIEEDIDDFIFIASKKETRKLSGETIRVYIAEYMKENEKATVEITRMKTTEAAKRFLSPWNTFTRNYKNYSISHISHYVLDEEYYALWMKNNIGIKIKFEKNEFPAELVDTYLEKHPGIKINLTRFETEKEINPPVQESETPSTPTGCGDKKIRGTERCDPSGSICIIEEFPILEIREGQQISIDSNKIKITANEIITDSETSYVFIKVNEITKLMQENQLMSFEQNGYVHVFSIFPNEVKLAFGYTLGNCSAGCRCIVEMAPTQKSICGDGKIEGIEECDPPGENCYARSGLLSTCTNECECPEPFFPLTFCGDGIVQRPNFFRQMEMCDPPNPQVGACNVLGQPGWCTQNCQCIVGAVPNICGDKILNPRTEECDPPGSLCIKEGKLSKCSDNCKCDIIIPQPTDNNEILLSICNTTQPECWGLGSCEKNGKQGECSPDCKCIIEENNEDLEFQYKEDQQIEYQYQEENSEEKSVCGNYIIESGEECDPPSSLCEFKFSLTTLDGICQTDCKCAMKDMCEFFPLNNSEEISNEVLLIFNKCKNKECPENAKLTSKENIITLTIKYSDIYYEKYSFINGEIPVEKFECTKVPEMTANQITGYATIIPQENKENKEIIIISILASFLIIGVMLFNFINK
jgi:hypothetical protein